MNKHDKWLHQALQLCAEVGQEDGIDPRLLAKHHRQHGVNKKALQLCKEAQRCLSLTLDGEINDPLLKDLTILDVSPLGQEQFLLLTISAKASAYDEAVLLPQLQQAQAHLRGILAQHLHRKRVPELRFKVLK